MTKHFLSALVCAAMIMAGCTMQRQQEQVSMDYPRAEWDRAGVILMHTPGQELFDGVIHPSAGLFEHYFDVDKAAEEHCTYIRLLEANGIRVHTVTGILNEVSMDTLRMLADHELTYDLSAMPDEEKAAAEAYRQEILSQMSRADLIRCILLRPAVRLLPADNNTGVEAEYVHEPLMNLYFTRDQSITTPRGHIICRMNSPQRAAETAIIDLCYRHLGLTPVLHIEGEGRLEGGDYIPAGTVAFIGCGMRTNEEGIRQIMEADAFGHDTIVVVHDHKRWQMQMHLDTHFNIIDRDLCTMVSSRLNAKPGEPEFNTCDIYAREPGKKSYNLLQKDLPFVEYMRGRGFEIIPIDYEDEMHYANNFLTIAPRHIMAVAGQSKAYQQRLADAGVTVEWVPLESLIDGYGAAHCMTQVLKRASAKQQPAPEPEKDSSAFVNLTDIIPDAVLEIRYYSTYNFVGERIDGYEQPVALMTRQAADSLKAVSDELKSYGYRLKIWDAYRPQTAVNHFIRWAENVQDTAMKKIFYPMVDKSVLFEQGYIYARSSHSRGSTVDLTLIDAATGKELDMGSPFDWFGEESHPSYPCKLYRQSENRLILRNAMLRHGFEPIDSEWWHFTLRNEPFPDTYFDFPIRQL